MAVLKKSSTKKSFAKKAPPKAPAPKAIIKKPVTKKTSTAPKPAKKTAVKKSPSKKLSLALTKQSFGLPEQLRDAVLTVLDERQAEDIVCITLTGRSSMADYLIIASGRAGRQVTAIADHLREAFFKLGVRKVRIEGQGEANWVLVDAGDVIVHLFRPEVRRYYDLDAIWTGKPSPE